MIFSLFKAENKAINPVLLIKTGKNQQNHPFLKSLSREEKHYFELVRTSFDPERQDHKVVILPSERKLLLVAAGPAKNFSHQRALLQMRHVIAAAKEERLQSIAISLDDFDAGAVGKTGLAELLAVQCTLANFEFNRYKETPPTGWVFVEKVFVSANSAGRSIEDALSRGNVIGEEINKARALANTPGGDMTPQKLAEAALRAGEECGFAVEVLDERAIREAGMGGVLGVSRGSDEPSKFIIMRHLKGPRSEKPVVLVGKGVTFDTGGLNIKPGEHIYEMHMDMSGGAAVIHTIAALARLGVKKNVIGLVPAVENMPSGSSYRPGDILKTMSGKTIEVLNTDAEGRIILADALTYARQFFKPRAVIDVATLTGAAEVALGKRVSAVFSNDARMQQNLIKAGEETGDRLWALPLWEEYEEEIKGTFGDVANIGKFKSAGGAITGAVFLWQFAKDVPWAHLDIAPRMTAVEGEWLAKGAAGASIYLLTSFIRNK